MRIRWLRSCGFVGDWRVERWGRERAQAVWRVAGGEAEAAG